VVGENDDKSESGSALPEKDVSKAKKNKKNSIPAGFALMHGFTATNVGKNRLTVSYYDCLPILTDFLQAQAWT
jgi:hypothetical protein